MEITETRIKVLGNCIGILMVFSGILILCAAAQVIIFGKTQKEVLLNIFGKMSNQYSLLKTAELYVIMAKTYFFPGQFLILWEGYTRRRADGKGIMRKRS